MNGRERTGSVDAKRGLEPATSEPAELPTAVKASPPEVWGSERARLLALGSKTVTTYPLPTEGFVTIGRSLRADVRLEDDSVSRFHARISVKPTTTTDPGLRVRDLGSSNGTLLSGRSLEAEVDYPFEPGDLIDIGQTTLIVKRGRVTNRARRLSTREEFELRLQEESERAKAAGSDFALIRVRATGGAAGSAAEESISALLSAQDAAMALAPSDYQILATESTPQQTEQMIEGICSALSRLGAAVEIGVASALREGYDPATILARAASSVRARGKLESNLARPSLVVEDGPMREIFRLADRVAGSNISVLLLGETGVGKEVLSKTIHSRSKRAANPFMAINCGALPEELLESELFGHEKGAFTGAVKTKSGLIESANGGTVFLDEIGEMPIATQVSLLRVIEERQVRRVGGVESRAIDVRFIAATNRDLEKEAALGRFRQDLYYRLAGFTLIVPPLRQRKTEIPHLANAFASEYWAREGRVGRPTFTDAAMTLLVSYAWPGNVRELRNVIERAVVLAGQGTIGTEHLPEEKLAALPASSARDVEPEPRRDEPLRPRSSNGGAEKPVSQPISASHESPTIRLPAEPPSFPSEDGEEIEGQGADGARQEAGSLLDDVEALEQRRILAALEACGGNQTRAAKMLGISRRALIIRLDRYGVKRPRKGREGEE